MPVLQADALDRRVRVARPVDSALSILRAVRWQPSGACYFGLVLALNVLAVACLYPVWELESAHGMPYVASMFIAMSTFLAGAMFIVMNRKTWGRGDAGLTTTKR